ncbi:hypothetical protein B296_00008301 [Ensete ventricosum]|uniref:Uncharacterized protein n=1 Tax=Ensete ventricosum TaxID=4639 RepID=A0A426XLY9_ENSVE|nr:hypothetical protein B296_00008301 [Ensete ventricosum]
MRALRSRPVRTLPSWLLQIFYYPYPLLVQSQGVGPFCSDVHGSMVQGAVGLGMAVSPCYDFLGLDGRPMLNSAKRDRIFSSMRFLKVSSFASIAFSDAIVYASRSVILKSFFYCQVSGMGILEKGVAGWKVNRFGWK